MTLKSENNEIKYVTKKFIFTVGEYHLTTQHLPILKKKMIIMHPIHQIFSCWIKQLACCSWKGSVIHPGVKSRKKTSMYWDGLGPRHVLGMCQCFCTNLQVCSTPCFLLGWDAGMNLAPCPGVLRMVLPLSFTPCWVVWLHIYPEFLCHISLSH